ncbi:MAG: radical SAM protein [Candidatus Pacearchaeota archaeon]|jgi:molybdenum cofactor biosynthesis enzyme MoaA
MKIRKKNKILIVIKMGKLRSLSLFVGTGECNGRCKHCAGVPLRKYAPKADGVINRDLIYKTVKECYSNGARSISISSSGEPTLSPLAVTKTLKLIDDFNVDGIRFSPINLYSNGIRIGEDSEFSKNYLGLWKQLGLTNVYITVHNTDEKRNARAYGIDSYPSLRLILSRIHNADLLMRANLVLSNKTISGFEEFVSTSDYLRKIGVDSISAWPIRTLDDKIDSEKSPSEEELDKIEEWIQKSGNTNIRLLREKSKVAYQTGQKLTLFPDGTLSNTWCNFRENLKGGD